MMALLYENCLVIHLVISIKAIILIFLRSDGTRSAAERSLATCGRQLAVMSITYWLSKPYLSMGAVFSMLGGLYF